MNFSVAQIWNSAFNEIPEERQLEKRDYLWASELGKAPIDVWLSMNAVKPTNPPDNRALRKFESGNLWEEILKIMFKRAGIFKSTQDHVEYQYDGLLKVTGRIDVIVGGKVDKDKAIKAMDEFDWIPRKTRLATRKVVESLLEKYPNGLPDIIYEVKSVSGMMYDKYDREGVGRHHAMQLYHYLKSTGLPEGRVIYIDRDAVRLLEYGISLNSQWENEYRNAVQTLTHYVKSNERPPIENLLVYELGKFKPNWRVMYSNYLSMLYRYTTDDGVVKPFEYQEEYRQWATKEANRFNAVLKAKKLGKPLTKLQTTTEAKMKSLYSGVELQDQVNQFVLK